MSLMGSHGDVRCPCPRAAGAELANVLNEAALETVRRRGESVSTADIYNGMDRILQVPASLQLLTHAASKADCAAPGRLEEAPLLRTHPLFSSDSVRLCCVQAAQILACHGNYTYMLSMI